METTGPSGTPREAPNSNTRQQEDQLLQTANEQNEPLARKIPKLEEQPQPALCRFLLRQRLVIQEDQTGNADFKAPLNSETVNGLSSTAGMVSNSF